jgi:hypothetical protein
MKRTLILISAALLCAACTTSTTVTLLEAAVNAAVAFDAVEQPANIPYLAIVTGCLDSAEVELASGQTALVESSVIAADCAAAVAAGKVGGITAQAVVAALNAFLAAVEVPATPAALSAAKVTPVKLSRADGARLKRIAGKIVTLKSRYGR